MQYVKPDFSTFCVGRVASIVGASQQNESQIQTEDLLNLLAYRQSGRRSSAVSWATSILR